MYTSSITVDQVIDALADAIQPFVQGAEIVRAQVNRVPMPDDNCIVLTELFQTNLSLPRINYSSDPDILTATLTGPTRIDVQVDFYGSQAGEFCRNIETMIGTPWGYDSFPVNIKPLYAGQGIQAPLITGEQQWQSRWTLTVSLQYNPQIEVDQESALELETTNDVIF